MMNALLSMFEILDNRGRRRYSRIRTPVAQGPAYVLELVRWPGDNHDLRRFALQAQLFLLILQAWCLDGLMDYESRVHQSQSKGNVAMAEPLPFARFGDRRCGY